MKTLSPETARELVEALKECLDQMSRNGDSCDVRNRAVTALDKAKTELEEE